MRSELPEMARTRHHWIVLLRPPDRWHALAGVLVLVLVWAAGRCRLILLVSSLCSARSRSCAGRRGSAEVIILTQKRIIRVQGVPETTTIRGARCASTGSPAPGWCRPSPASCSSYGTIELEAPGDHPDVRRAEEDRRAAQVLRHGCAQLRLRANRPTPIRTSVPPRRTSTAPARRRIAATVRAAIGPRMSRCVLIDLHAHSTASDGTDTPAELVAAAAARASTSSPSPITTRRPGGRRPSPRDPRGVRSCRAPSSPASTGPTRAGGSACTCSATCSTRTHEALRAARARAARQPPRPRPPDGREHGRRRRPDHVGAGAARSPAAARSGARTSAAPWSQSGRRAGRRHRVPRPAVVASALLRAQGRPGRVRRDRADPRCGRLAGVRPSAGAPPRARCSRDDVIAAMAAAGLVGIEVDHPDHDADDRAHAARLATRARPDPHRIVGLSRHEQVDAARCVHHHAAMPTHDCSTCRAPGVPIGTVSCDSAQGSDPRLRLAVERALAVLRGQGADGAAQRRAGRRWRSAPHPAAAAGGTSGAPRAAADRRPATRQWSSPAGPAARSGGGRAAAAASTTRAASRASGVPASRGRISAKNSFSSAIVVRGVKTARRQPVPRPEPARGRTGRGRPGAAGCRRRVPATRNESTRQACTQASCSGSSMPSAACTLRTRAAAASTSAGRREADDAHVGDRALEPRPRIVAEVRPLGEHAHRPGVQRLEQERRAARRPSPPARSGCARSRCPDRSTRGQLTTLPARARSRASAAAVAPGSRPRASARQPE